MVTVIKGKSANELFVNFAKELLKNGHLTTPRDLLTREIKDAWLILEDTTQPIVTLPARKIDMKYLAGELSWYKSGSLNVEDIAKHSRFWKRLADTNGTVNSNYGFLALKEKFSGLSQYEWCVKKLQEDPNTRQAIINYNQPRHKYPGNKDFVCTLNQLFRQHDGVIDTTVFMRSNDLIFGLTYDMPWFTMMLDWVCEETGFKPGVYQHYAASLHVYEKHFGMLEAIAKSKLPAITL